MSTLQIYRQRPEVAALGKSNILMPSLGSGPTSVSISQKLEQLRAPTPTFAGAPPRSFRNLDEQLYDALAAFKIQTAQVAMHLDRDWRTRLFRQLDNLLSKDDWQLEDTPPLLSSYSTFLRMLTLLRPGRRPGLGATHDGRLIATWTAGDDRLTIECLPKDFVRWHLSVTIEGDRERAAAETPLSRLLQVLQPYEPSRWFADADNIPAG
jgi:hypothetical protein